MHAVKVLTGAIASALLFSPTVYGAGETDGGFKIETDRYSFQIGGRIHYDTSYMDDIYLNGGENRNSGPVADRGDDSRWNTQLRRTRMYVKGKVLGSWDYKLQYDFASTAQNADSSSGTRTSIKDAYVGWNGFSDWLQLRFGQYKEPFGLNELTSSNDITTIERSFISDLIVPGRNQGISLRGNGNWGANYLHYHIGGFVNSDSANSDTGDVHAVTGRVVYARQFRQSDTRFFHLGGALSSRNQGDNSPARPFTSRLEVDLADQYTFTDSRPDSDDTLQLGLELAFMWNRFDANFEYFYVEDNEDTDPISEDYEFYGGYIELSGFLTPDHRTYKFADGIYGKVTPERSYGAWQVYFRFSMSDLDDSPRNGDDDVDVYNLGLNWYTNNHIRFNLAYTYADADGDRQVDGSSEDDGNAITLRAYATW